MDILILLLFWSLFALKVASELAPVVIAIAAVKALRHYVAQNPPPTKPNRLASAFRAAKAELFKKS